MEDTTVKRILKLNKDFYQSVAKEFSRSRGEAWKGWRELLDYLNETKAPVKVLDLGSGNSRFYAFLKNSFNRDISYLGLDQCSELIRIAEKKYAKNTDFEAREFDVIDNISSVNGKFDLVVAFGLTHHIPSNELRARWFDEIGKLVSKGGLLVLSFWNTSQKIKTSQAGHKQGGLDEGDKFLSWNNRGDISRYVHIYSDNEIKLLIKKYKESGLALVKKYHADKNKSSDNLYLIFKRV